MSVAAVQAATLVYADCRAALAEAWRRGLPREAQVRTLAPAILADDTIAAQMADERLTPDKIAALEDALLASADDLWRGVRAIAEPAQAAGLALVAGRALFTDFQGYLYAAAALRDEPVDASCAVVTAVQSDANLRRRFRYRVADIVSLAGDPTLIEVPAEHLPRIAEPAPPQPPLARRLAQTNLRSVLYRLGIEAWQRLAVTPPRGTILVLRENELVKEAGAHLMARGFAVRSLAQPRFPEPAVDGEAWGEVTDLTAMTLRRRFRRLIGERALPALEQLGARAVAEALTSFRDAQPLWREALDRQKRWHCRAVLTNMLLTPQAVALHRVLRERDIPLITVQHGVTPEISKRTSRYALSFENAASDLALTFNERAARLFNRSPYSGARAVAVGMPSDYRKVGRRTREGRKNPIWYVCTNLYQSNLARLHRGIADTTMYAREADLIECVFAGLPHRVTYKPYPAVRYLDPDPALELAARTPGVEVYKERLDFRYLALYARMLVTAGATSTVSWCLMSDKPTVFLHYPDAMPLDDEALEAFRLGVFVFDHRTPDFHERLRAFLAQPMSDIEAAWRERAAARKRLISDFIAAPIANGGRSAADAVVSFLEQRGARDD
ncbi:MAG: hypothetical protein QGF53_09630 [Alphaproteobacteria bacterium]|nr:hypothetical protein [Alphaproteobacteria bacterium]